MEKGVLYLTFWELREVGAEVLTGVIFYFWISGVKLGTNQFELRIMIQKGMGGVNFPWAKLDLECRIYISQTFFSWEKTGRGAPKSPLLTQPFSMLGS